MERNLAGNVKPTLKSFEEWKKNLGRKESGRQALKHTQNMTQKYNRENRKKTV